MPLVSEAVAEHEELMEAPGSGHAVAAGEVWDRHLRHTGDTVAAILRDGDGSPHT